MKVTATIDWTPEEARVFFGLPDVKPMQAAVMQKLEQQVVDAASALAPESILKTWFTLLPQASDQFQKTLLNVMTLASGGAPQGKT